MSEQHGPAHRGGTLGKPGIDWVRSSRSVDPLLEQRFWIKVDKGDGSNCWVWKGAKDRSGYGVFNVLSVMFGAHRVSYEWLVGPIPPSLQIDHLCRNRACINPAHMEVVTLAENVRRARMIGHNHPSAPTTCKRGHDWSVTPPKITRRRSGHLSRACRVCASEWKREWRRRG